MNNSCRHQACIDRGAISYTTLQDDSRAVGKGPQRDHAAFRSGGNAAPDSVEYNIDGKHTSQAYQARRIAGVEACYAYLEGWHRVLDSSPQAILPAEPCQESLKVCASALTWLPSSMCRPRESVVRGEVELDHTVLVFPRLPFLRLLFVLFPQTCQVSSRRTCASCFQNGPRNERRLGPYTPPSPNIRSPIFRYRYIFKHEPPPYYFIVNFVAISEVNSVTNQRSQASSDFFLGNWKSTQHPGILRVGELQTSIKPTSQVVTFQERFEGMPGRVIFKLQWTTPHACIH